MGTGPPSGTVTFLFTDVESSTELWQDHSAEMGEAMRIHDHVVRGLLASHGGFVFATGGDGFAAAFARASDAVAAALGIQAELRDQTWPDGIVLVVRMGLHTGEAEERDTNFFGDVVNRAARVMDAAGGCQVLVSATTAGLVRGRLPQGVTMFEHGWYHLRSFVQPELLFEVLVSGSTPLPLVRVKPRQSTSVAERRLVGRHGELVELDRLLQEARLVTLTGPGGVGKTALALEAVSRRAGDFADGIYVVELAPVADAGSVPLILGEVLSLRPQAGATPTELVIRALAQQHALLVLDNCEHVLDVVSPLVGRVVQDCPAVTVLATSREALRLPAEHTYEVRPLSTDAAVQLFGELLAQHHGGFTVTASDVADVAELCDRLDCLPLAIELAAARARSMPLEELVARLNERFRLFRGGRTAAERHQTLRHTVGWSYDLLTDEQRSAFARLSVFAGGFTFRAAEAVCRNETVDDLEIDTVIAGLADKSMVAADLSGRYSMLETLRQFGEERLRDRGEVTSTRRLHLAHYVQFVRSAHDGLLTADEHLWWQRLQAEWANIRAAFSWASQTGDVASAATLAVKLTWAAHWHDTAEPYSWAREVLDLPGADTNEAAVDVLAANAFASWERGELTAALELGRRALALERPDQRNIDYYAEHAVLAAAHFLDDPDEAAAFIEQAVRRAHNDNQTTLESFAVSARAVWFNTQERYEEGGLAAALARHLAESSGNPSVLAWAMCHQAASLAPSDPASAIVLLEDALRLARANELTLAGFLAQHRLAPLLVTAGRTNDAMDHVTAGLATMRRRSSWMFALQILVEATELLHVAGDDRTAATVYGALRTSSIAGAAQYAQRLGRLRDSLAQQLGQDLLEALASEGERTPIERVVSLAETTLKSQAAANRMATGGPEPFLITRSRSDDERGTPDVDPRVRQA